MTSPDLSKSPARIASMFDAIAGRYDVLNHVLSGGFDIWWRKRAIEALELHDRERVLDLCTGTGDIAIAAVRARPGAARVIGIDFAGAMLLVGRDKLRRQRLDDRVALVRGDATRIPLADASVHAVTIAFGIRNIDCVRDACAEMRRVLQPDGRLAILEFAVPTTPWWRSVYGVYLKHVLPRVGRAVSRNASAYAYLPASIEVFSSPDELMKILRQAGFVDIAASPLTLGSVILYTARRG